MAVMSKNKALREGMYLQIAAAGGIPADPRARTNHQKHRLAAVRHRPSPTRAAHPEREFQQQYRLLTSTACVWGQPGAG